MQLSTEQTKEAAYHFGKFFDIVYSAGAKEGAKEVVRELQEQHIIPMYNQPDKEYSLREIPSLYLKDKRFKKVSKGTIGNWVKADIIKNYGTSRNQSYKESELLSAMEGKGRKRAD